MSQQISATSQQRLKNVRRALLHLHKTLLDMERAVYEQARGRVSSGELLQLVINHEQFAWLRSLSALIVRIDEMLDSEEPVTEDEAESLLAEARALLKPVEAGNNFEQRYFAALQREPAAVIAHRELVQLLTDQGQNSKRIAN